MSGHDEKKGLHSLKDLGGVALAPPPETTELTLAGLDLNLEDLKARAQKIIEEAGKIRGWVRSTVGQLEALAGENREVRELVAGDMAKAQDGLTKLLNHKTPAFRRAAWLGLLEYEFSKKLCSRTEVEGLLGRLVREGRLVENSNGAGALTFMAYKKIYAVSPDSCFESEEMAEIRRIFGKLLNRVFEETGKVRTDKAQDLQAQGTISLAELVAGKPGKCALVVPAEKDASGKWRGGGLLFVESNEQDIRPLDAAGTIERVVEEAQALKIFLKVHTLAPGWLRPPVVPGIPEEMVKKIQLLWYLIRRSMRAENEAKLLAKAKDDLASRATVTLAEFFLGKKPGICLAEFQGTWANQDGSPGPSNFFFLVERKEEEGTKRIRIADVPSHLGGFFDSCMGEYTEEGDKFKGLPYPLIAVLQAVYGQTLAVSQDAGKVGQIAN